MHHVIGVSARLAQLVERQALNLMVVGSSPTVGVFCKNNSGNNYEKWPGTLCSKMYALDSHDPSRPYTQMSKPR